MISPSPPVYPAEYYYPEFIDSRSDDPRLSPPRPPSLSKSVTSTKSLQQLTNWTKNLAINVVTHHVLPAVGINESAKIDPQKSLIRDPIERNIPRLIVNQHIYSSTIPVANLDNNQYIERKQFSNIFYINLSLLNMIKILMKVHLV